jgi:hypothetical protein
LSLALAMKNGRGNRASNSREERLQIMLSPEELTAVDNFRFEHRMPSRAAAVRELFRLGLTVSDTVNATAGTKSSDYGVLGPAPNEAGSSKRK